MKGILLLSILSFIAFRTNAQNYTHCNKAILNQAYCISLDSNSSVNLQFKNQPIPKSFNTYANRYNAYQNIPICWDVVDSFLFQLNLYRDQQGMVLSKLMYYNLNTIKNLDAQKIKDYINDIPASTVSRDLPLYEYMYRIAYRNDTLKGPVLFDMHVINYSVQLFIYVHDSKNLEIWNFNDLSPLRKRNSAQQSIEYNFFDQWTRAASIPANLSAPFRVVHTQGRDYLITTAGDILRIGKNSVEPTGKLPTLPGKGILVIDKGKDAVYFMEERWMAEVQKRPLEEIISREAIRILKEK
jgi:hypothetical protein